MSSTWAQNIVDYLPFHGRLSHLIAFIPAPVRMTISIIPITLIAVLMGRHRALTRKTRQYEKMARRYANTVDIALDAVVVADGQGRIIDFNGAAERAFGYSRNAAVGQNMAELLIPRPHRVAYNAGMERLIETGASRIASRSRVKLEGLRAGGETFPIELSLGMTDDPDGPIFTAYFRDISDEVRAQTELTIARDEALAAAGAKSQFLAVMSHEMRTPLNGVLAVLDILTSSRLDDKQRRFVEAAINSGELLQRHIDGLLQLNELENRQLTFHRSTFSVGELLRDIVAMNSVAAATHGNKIFTNSDISELYLSEDRHRLSQVLANLVSNAIKFTRNGSIKIEIGRVTGEDGEHILEVVVSDTGAGIAEEDKERIFDVFVTLDPTHRQTTRGYGLGLAICRRIVRAMGGDIGVESLKDCYSRFWVRLPFREASAVGSPPAFKASAERPFELPGGPSSLRVLLVEDDETNRLVAREMLVRFGCSVTEAHNGLEAIREAESKNFDLILMDVNMPNLGGHEATRRIRHSVGSASRFSPIVGLTAHALPEEQERLHEAGMQECLIKPIRARNLQALFRRLTDFPGDFSSEVRRAPPEAPSAGVYPARDIDEATLGEMASLLPPAVFQRQLSVFRTEIEGMQAGLAQAWSKRSSIELSRLAHRYGGGAAIFGAFRLREHMLKIEKYANLGQDESVSVLIGELSTLCPQMLKSLNAYSHP